MSKSSIGRREFAFGAAAVATAAFIGPADALAQSELQLQQPQAATPLQQQIQSAMAKLSPQAQAEVEMKVASIFRKYGDKLSDEQKADIRRIMAEGQEGLEKMRAYVLENDDQPATVFHPYRQAGHHREGHRRAASHRAGHTAEGKR
jgi:hypothetical protein